jgi:hypothetical protein
MRPIVSALSRREKDQEENLPLVDFWKGSLHAKRVRREVAVAGEVRAAGWCRVVRYDSLGLNKKPFDTCGACAVPVTITKGQARL